MMASTVERVCFIIISTNKFSDNFPVLSLPFFPAHSLKAKKGDAVHCWHVCLFGP